MGHVRLGKLPQSRAWKEVVRFLEAGIDVEVVAAKSQEAAEAGLKALKTDPALVHALWLLTQLPVAARSDDFVGHLENCGVKLGDNPGLLDLVGAFSDAVDARVRFAVGRTDLGEMAQLAAQETLLKYVGDRLPGLFEPLPADLQGELRKLGTEKQFGAFARDFFARLTRRHLEYWLSRETSEMVGGRGRFESVREHGDFHQALELHCRQTSEIVETFAGQWWSKGNWKGELDPVKVGGFAHHAMTKIGAELRRRMESP